MAVLPALSVAVHSMLCAPLVLVFITSQLDVATPESASLAFGSALTTLSISITTGRIGLRVGGVLSMLIGDTLTGAAVSPDTSTQGPGDAIGLAAFHGPFHLEHIRHRNTLGDTDDEIQFGIQCLKDRISGKWRRNVDHAGVGAGFFLRLGNGIKARNALEIRTALARRDTRHHLGAVIAAAAGVKLAGGAGDTLGYDLGVLVNKNRHDLAGLLHEAGDLFSSISEAVGRNEVES